MSGQKPIILFVDDEERILRSLKMLFMAKYDVKITTDGYEALKILEQEKVHVLVSDQRMPIMMGVDLLRQASKISPNTMRLLLTGYSDLAAIVGSVNEGEIFRYINKPWKSDELKTTLQQAVDIALTLVNTPTLSKESAPLPTGGVEILVIDDAQEAFTVTQGLMSNTHKIYWATSIDEAFAILSQHSNIGIVVSEVRIGNDDITNPLKTLKRFNPNILTIVLTSFQDTKALIDLINHGQIYRFLPKPVHKGLLEKSLDAALRHHQSLQHTPILTLRHQVDAPKEESNAQISNSVMGYLQKIRNRVRRNQPLVETSSYNGLKDNTA